MIPMRLLFYNIIVYLDINIFLFFLSIFPDLIFFSFKFSFLFLLDDKEVYDSDHMM